MIELTLNGDPFGSGFVGSEWTKHGWVYRGDIGAQTREWWRNYCRRNKLQLREAQ